jgi:hypothetical protein
VQVTERASGKAEQQWHWRRSWCEEGIRFFEFNGEIRMPYDASRLSSDTPATDPEPTHPSDPFLQFVDPPMYRQLVERVLSSTGAGRFI